MNIFAIDIGDRYHDGHNKHQRVLVQSNKTIDLVRKAYKRAYYDHDNTICPDQMCTEYEDRKIKPKVWEKIKGLGITPQDLGVTSQDGFEWFEKCKLSFEDPEMFALYVLWFTKLGDPELELKMIEVESLGTFGYGLFGG